MVEANDDFDKNITKAIFSPNATLDWYKHATNQIIVIVNGKGHYQEGGKEPIVLYRGDVLNVKKDTEHWHAYSVDSSVSYIAIDGKEPTIWTEKLTLKFPKVFPGGEPSRSDGHRCPHRHPCRVTWHRGTVS